MNWLGGVRHFGIGMLVVLIVAGRGIAGGEGTPEADAPVEIGSRLELFVDRLPT